MPCFGSSDDSRFSLIPPICIHCSFPPDPEIYLPRITEHKIQTEPLHIIDDPSSIFFDPNEKPGFVYTHIPSISIEYDKQLILTLPDNKHEQVTKTEIENENNTVRERQLSVCSEFADSLDRTPSCTGSPLHDTGNYQAGFNEHFKPISRQDSLEFDPIVDDSNYKVTLNHKDFSCRPATTHHPAGLSEDDVRKLYETSHEPFFIDDFNDLHIYEEDILNEITKASNGSKGYVSDAESIKTYQDSGICDDDIIIESPNRRNAEECTEEEILFGDDGETQMEKYSAFKTPLSSRHNSLEYLALESPIKQPASKARRKLDDGGEDAEEKATTASGEELNMQLIESLLDTEDLQTNDKPWKKTDKYSHIQAKVQCFRSKSERSPSPGTSLRKKTPEKPQKSELKRTQSRLGAKPKVDSMSNVKYTPGGGSNKVFKEKLKFRENAQPRTDTHGIEMYAHLPSEFQEIARRLARQDSQLKDQKTRGRSLSRSKSASRNSSRSPKRGRSRTKKQMTPGDSISNIVNEVNQKKLALESLPIVKPPTLSRSSSIRSVPSAPKISQRHPSSSKIIRTSSTMSSQSPTTATPDKTKTKKKETPKSKDTTPRSRDTTPKSAKSKENTPKSKTNTPKSKESTPKSKETTPKSKEISPKLKENTPKSKDITPKSKETTPKLKENTPKLKEVTPKAKEITPKSKETPPKSKESPPKTKDTKVKETTPKTKETSKAKDLPPSNNVTSLCQFISENDGYPTKQRAVAPSEDVTSNPVPSLCQYISDNELFESTQLSSSKTLFQAVPAH